MTVFFCEFEDSLVLKILEGFFTMNIFLCRELKFIKMPCGSILMSWDFFLQVSIVLSDLEFSLVVKVGKARHRQTMSWHFHAFFVGTANIKGLTSGNHLLSSKNGKWYRQEAKVSSKGVNTKNTTYNQLFLAVIEKTQSFFCTTKIAIYSFHKYTIIIFLAWFQLNEGSQRSHCDSKYQNIWKICKKDHHFGFIKLKLLVWNCQK